MEVSLQVDRVVGEHWRLRRRLGEEGTSRFWEAEELRASGRVAIEFACIDISDSQARLRFSRETQSLMAFRSPHVVRTIHRGLADDGLAFAVTEWLHGEDLARKLARESALGLPETAQILHQICRALSSLEAAKIRHRLLEPKHVFIADDRANAGVVKLLNVGLEAGTLDARSPYVSSERIGAAATADSSTQVWALGVLGYRMLTRTFPVEADRLGTLRADWRLGLVTLHEELKGLPRELDEWFETALQWDPAQRFATVEQAGLAFGHIASTYATNAANRIRREMHPTAPERAAPAGRRRVALIEWDARALERERAAKLEGERDAALASDSAAPAPRDAAVGAGRHKASDPIHDRKTVPSPLHAAAKRRKRVTVSERLASQAVARGTGSKPVQDQKLSAEAAAGTDHAVEGRASASPSVRTRVAPLLPLPGNELAPIRERARGLVVTTDPEHALALRDVAAIQREVRIVAETRAADRDLTYIARRSDAGELERDRARRAERMRWRVSAVLAVLIGLGCGFVLRSTVTPWLAQRDGAPLSTTISAARSSGPASNDGAGLPPPATESEPRSNFESVALSVVHASGSQAIARPRIDASLTPSSPGRAAPARTTAISPPTLPPSAAEHEPSSDVLATLHPRPVPAALERPIAQPPRAASRSAVLPAAPPATDTTPVSVYRGF